MFSANRGRRFAISNGRTAKIVPISSSATTNSSSSRISSSGRGNRHGQIISSRNFASARTFRGNNSSSIRCCNRFLSTTPGEDVDPDQDSKDNDRPSKIIIETIEDDDSYRNFEDYDRREKDDDYDDSRPSSRSKRGSKNYDNEIDYGDDDYDFNLSDREPKRIWLDPSLSLKERVNRFLNRDLGRLHPLDVSLASVDLIRECCKLNNHKGMQYGHDILERLLEEKHHINQFFHSNSDEEENDHIDDTTGNSSPLAKYPIFISERPFKVLMYGWSNMSRKVKIAPDRMREILDRMIQEAQNDRKIQQFLGDAFRVVVENEKRKLISEREYVYAGMSCEPTVDIYNTLLQGLEQAAHRSFNAAFAAENLLQRMERYHANLKWHTKPNTRSFALVLKAYANTRHETAGDRAEHLLRQMIEYHNHEKQMYEEETCMEYIIESEHVPSSDSANKRRIVTPDTIAYTTVIQAHANSDAIGSGEKALGLLSELIHSDSSLLRPDSYAFANTINAFVKMAGRATKIKVRRKAAETAEDILWMMVDECQNQQEFEASVVPFNATLNAWIQANVAESPIRAEEILQKMLDTELQNKTKVFPNTVTFNACMQAWAKAAKDNHPQDGPTKAEEVLRLVIQEQDTIGSPPDIHSFTTVMNAYARSKSHKDKAAQTRRILRELLGAKTDSAVTGTITIVPFTVVLNAVASSNSPNAKQSVDADDGFGTGDNTISEEDPYSIALETYNDVINDMFDLSIEPDHTFFATMIDVIGRHTDGESVERRNHIETIFGDCCRYGAVSSLVLESLMDATSSRSMGDPTFLQQSLLQGIAPSSIQNVDQLPEGWTQNVPPQFRKFHGPRWRRRQNRNKGRQGDGKRSSGGKGGGGQLPRS